MSTQSVLVKNLESYQEIFDNRLFKIADSYQIYRRFMIGQKMNFSEMMFVKSFHNLLCTDNCELIEWVNKKIKGKLKECGVKHKKKPTISDLFKIYQQQIENCSLTEAASCCDWEAIEW